MNNFSIPQKVPTPLDKFKSHIIRPLPHKAPLLNPAHPEHMGTSHRPYPPAPPSRSDSRECHQCLVPNPLPKRYALINDFYRNEHLFNPTKGTPLEGSKTQLINPPPSPDIKSSPVGVVHDFGVLDVLNVVG